MEGAGAFGGEEGQHEESGCVGVGEVEVEHGRVIIWLLYCV